MIVHNAKRDAREIFYFLPADATASFGELNDDQIRLDI